MGFSYDHERFVAKNRALASAEETDRRDEVFAKRGIKNVDEKKSCFNCKMKATCPEFRAKRSGRGTGVVSFGGDDSLICDKYTPAVSADAKSMSNKQIKSLLKNVRKGY